MEAAGGLMTRRSYVTRADDAVADKLTLTNLDEVATWCNGTIDDHNNLRLPTVDGTVLVEIGEYVVKKNGLFYAQSAVDFEKKWVEPVSKVTHVTGVNSGNGITVDPGAGFPPNDPVLEETLRTARRQGLFGSKPRFGGSVGHNID